jgi:predicted dehydrogenase
MSWQQQVSRRKLFEHGAAVAGAVAVPWLIPSGLLAAPGRPGPNDRIGVAYIGVGRRGQQLMGLPKQGRIVAVSDIYRPRADQIAAKLKCRAYYDYRKMLESADVDAVIIATPDHWHALPSIHACQAGKHVYTEKPLTLTIREGRAMVAAARKYRCAFQTGSNRRSMDRHRIGCQLVRAGLLGKIHTVIAANYPSPWNCGLPGQPVPAGLDWDVWCGQTQPRPYHMDIFTPRAKPGWISFTPYSGGEATGWGAHGLDQIQWALGADATGPVEIWPETNEPLKPPTYVKPEKVGRGNNLCSHGYRVAYRYANGVVVKLDNGPPSGGEFHGERGTLWMDNDMFRCDPPELADQPLPAGAPRLIVSNNHFQNWFDCIKSGKRPVADVEIGHRSATICHLVNIARWLGRKLQWDPEKEIFPGDEEANQYLDRPKRKSYELPKIA